MQNLVHAKKSKSSVADLVSLFFLSQILGTLAGVAFYQAFILDRRETPDLSPWGLHLVIGVFSTMTVIGTVMLERHRGVYLARVVAKWLFRSWLAVILVSIARYVMVR
jgi:hypothetical protein